jgi:SnoaL-like domain
VDDIAALAHRVEELENRLGLVEDAEEIKRLQMTYGYYNDNQLWPQVVDLFATEGAAMEIGRRGRYLGKEHILAFLGQLGSGGLKRDQFVNHLQIQGVVSVDPDRQHAKARWRALIPHGPRAGGSFMVWSEGTYENTYVKEEGRWKIQLLWWAPTFYAQIPIENITFLSGPPSEALPPDLASVPIDEALGRSFLPFHYRHPITDEPLPQSPVRSSE